MPVIIRIRTPEDYPAIAAVYNAAYPPDTIQTNPADLEHMDTAIGPKYHPRRAVLEYDGRIVGVCRSAISPMIYHPQKFQTQIAVHPEFQRQLNTDDTGVIRDYRRRGIALALKVHGIAHAKENGYKKIRTMNESTNRAMLNINERLGFAKRPAWIAYMCAL